MMSHTKVRLIVALVAAATLSSASSAQAQSKKKNQNFADLLSAAAVNTATTTSPITNYFSSSTISARAATGSISASTVYYTPRAAGTSLAAYRASVYQQLLVNRFNLFSELATLRSEYRSGQISLAQFSLARNNDFSTFYAVRTPYISEYFSGVPVPYTGGVSPLTATR